MLKLYRNLPKSDPARKSFGKARIGTTHMAWVGPFFLLVSKRRPA